MSKKTKSKQNDQFNLPRRLIEGLQKAETLLHQKQPLQAIEVLSVLEKSFPHHPDVFGFLAEAYQDVKDQHGYLVAQVRLHELVPDDADIKIGLGGAYLANGYFGLAYRVMGQFIKRWTRDERVPDVQKLMQTVEKELDKFLFELDYPFDSGFEFICQHEELRLNLEIGNYAKCQLLAKALISRRPGFVPALNNLSQAEWLDGSMDAAIFTSRRVLEIDPENIHALSNLTRFLFMQGKTEEAQEYARRLKSSQAEVADRWVKIIEALNFIGDDTGVLAVLEQVTQDKGVEELSGHAWHWCAVAEYRLGNLSKAKAYWQKCLKKLATHALAAANLEEMKKPVNLRICPQVFALDTWLPKKTIEELYKAVLREGKKVNESQFQAKMAAFVDTHPEIFQFVQIALKDGDLQCRELALKFVDMSAHPRLLGYLNDFCLSQHGPDELRLNASQLVTKYGLVKSGELVNLWLDGEWRPVLMLGFQIVQEPMGQETLKPAVLRLMEKAVTALREKDGINAETYLRKALNIQKDEPGLLNNLAYALDLQGKKSEAEAILDSISVRFPDYFFGQVTAARKAIKAKKLDAAKKILDGLMQKKEFHVTEFGAFCSTQVDLLIADGKPDDALLWFDLWEKGYPDDPEMSAYRQIMNMIKITSNLKKGLFPTGRKKKTSS